MPLTPPRSLTNTNNRRYTSFADLAKAIGTTPEQLRKAYLDKAIAGTIKGEEAGSAITPEELDEIADMIRDDTITDSFHEAFGDVGALSILEIGDTPQELDMPEPAEAQADCHAIVTTIFDLFRDTRLEPSAQAIAWGIVNSFHYEAEKLSREADRLWRRIAGLRRIAGHGPPSRSFGNPRYRTGRLAASRTDR